MALPEAIDIRISMLRLAPQCFAFTSIPNSFVSVGNHRHMVYVYNNGVYGWSAYMVHFIWTLCV